MKDFMKDIDSQVRVVLVYHRGAVVECYELTRKPGDWYPSYAWRLSYSVLTVWPRGQDPVTELLVGVESMSRRKP